MSFKKNDPQTKQWAKLGGRRGYEFEKKQLELMREIVSNDFYLLEKIYNGTATESDCRKLKITQSRILKYLDKLHPSKQNIDATLEGERITGINYIIPKKENN